MPGLLAAVAGADAKAVAALTGAFDSHFPAGYEEGHTPAPRTLCGCGTTSPP